MTQEELIKAWNDADGAVHYFSIWEGKFLVMSRMVVRLKEDYLVRLPNDYPKYYLIPRSQTPFAHVSPGHESRTDQRGYWQDKIDELRLQRLVKSPIHGSYDEAYRLIDRFMSINGWHGGGPPACTEERCYEEEIFQDFLKIAEQNFIKDMAAAFGYRITGMEENQPPYKW